MQIAIKVVSGEERAIAEMIADEIVEGWETDRPASSVDTARRKFVDDLLWTARGREHLVKVRRAALS